MSQPNKIELPLTTTKYRPIAELGRGGMATVYLTVVQGPGGFNKLQVLKRLRPALAADPEFLQMFLEEARLSARINHPNVVQTNEVGFDGQYYYIAMEYLDGQPLEAILRRARDRIETKMMPLELHLKVLADALGGLNFAHDLADFDGTPLNVVHRDMSPHNVVVTYEGSVKVLDFGIAKAADSSSDTRTGIMKGKCAYMAAEQFGGKNVDRRADVFAVGVMLWQAATGRRLWQNLGDAEIFAKLAKSEIPPPRSIREDIPEALEKIIMKALAQSPEDRYATAADFQAALEGFMATLPTRITQRELGKFVADLFEDRRKTIKEAIEAQLKNPEVISSSDVRKTGEVPLLWSLAPASTTGSSSSTMQPTETLSNDAVEIVGAQSPRRRRLMLLVGLGAAAVLTITVALFAKSHSTPTEPVAGPNDSAAASDSAAPRSTQDSTPALIQVSVKATPPESKIFLDDALLPGNPVTSSFPKDGAAHMLRVEAPGYDKKTQLVTFDQSRASLDIALDKETKHLAVWRPPTHGKSTGGGDTNPAPQQPQTDATVATAAPTAAPTSTNPPDIRIKQHGPALDTTSDPWSGKPAPKPN
jgi:serine/threonine-protein kinase